MLQQKCASNGNKRNYDTKKRVYNISG